MNEEQRKEISIRQTGSGNSMYGKTPWNKGLTKETNTILASVSKNSKENSSWFKKGHVHSTETKNKISHAHKGKILSRETKEKLSLLNIGKKLSQTTKLKMSVSRKNVSQKIVYCPHCNKHGGASVMKRWHFDNCKNK